MVIRCSMLHWVMTITLTPRNLLRNAELYANEPALSVKAGKAPDGSWEWDTKTWKQFSDEVVSVSNRLSQWALKKETV